MKIAFSIAVLVFDALACGCFSNRCIAVLLVQRTLLCVAGAHPVAHDPAQQHVQHHGHRRGKQQRNHEHVRGVQERAHDSRSHNGDDTAPVYCLDAIKRADAARADLHGAAHDVVVGYEQEAPRHRQDAAIAHEGVNPVQNSAKYEDKPDCVRDDHGNRPLELDTEQRIEEVRHGVRATDRVRRLNLHLREANDEQSDEPERQHERHARVRDCRIRSTSRVVPQPAEILDRGFETVERE